MVRKGEQKNIPQEYTNRIPSYPAYSASFNDFSGLIFNQVNLRTDVRV